MRDLAHTQKQAVDDHLASRGQPVAGFAFWGHSLGARVAFEVALARARAREAPPSHLFLSACPPPHHAVVARRSTLPDRELVAALAQLDASTGDVLENPVVREYTLRRIRADLAVFEGHVPSSPTPLSCDITVLGGRHDAAAPPERLRGWELWTRGRVRYLDLDGGHFFVTAHRPAVSSQILDALARPAESSAGRRP